MNNSVKNLSPLEFSSRQFVQKNFDLFLDALMLCDSKKLSKLFEVDELFENLCSHLKNGNLVCFTYMQNYLNEIFKKFGKEMQQYFS
jgi:hypothetical protein